MISVDGVTITFTDPDGVTTDEAAVSEGWVGAVWVESLGGNDVIAMNTSYDEGSYPRRMIALTGDGDDVVYGGNGGDWVECGTGNDLANRFVGGSGNDRFVSSLGNDTYGGGGGVDAVDYRTAATGQGFVRPRPMRACKLSTTQWKAVR